METQKHFKFEKKTNNLLNFVTFKELKEKSAFLKTAAQASEAGDFLNVFREVFLL